MAGGRAKGSGGPRVFDPEEAFRLLADPVQQWLDWEEQANLVGFRATTVPVRVELSAIPRDELELHVLPGAPREIVDRFLRGDRVLCARHPLNQDPGVAWQTTPVAERWSARFTSSRASGGSATTGAAGSGGGCGAAA